MGKMADKNVTNVINGTADKTDIAVIKTDLGYIKGSLADLSASVKGLPAIFASKESLVVVARETEQRLTKLEASSNLWKWLSPSFAAILSSVMTFLIIQYLTRQ